MVGICRLCAALRKLDALITITDTNHAVCRKLRECCQIDIRLEDTLPKCICCDCVEALQQAHSFYIKVHESQESLTTLFSSTARGVTDVTLNTAKPPTLAESLAPAFHLIKETKTGCVDVDKALKSKVHVTEEKENSEQREGTMILDEDEVNLMLEKVEEEIDDEVFLIEQILGRKCDEDNEEEQSCDATLTATSNSLDELKLKKIVHRHTDTHDQPSGSAGGREAHVDIETFHIISGDEVEDEEEEEEMEGEEKVGIVEELNEEKVLEEQEELSKEREEVQEQPPIELQLPAHDTDDIQLDTWNAYPWLCYICSVEEASFIDILLHCQVAHDLQSWKDMQYKCVDCQKTCPRYYSFLNHVRFRHREPLALCCDVCNKDCSDFKHLESHRREKHANNTDYPLIHLCGECGHGFNDQNSRQIHSKIHSQSGKNFECTKCGKRFARYVAWKTHQKVHSDIKEFSCEQCGKSFRQKINLDTHILTHVGDRPYECSTCQKNFKTPASLEKHIKTHSSVKNFKCDYCENMFRTKDAKLSHERTHTGEKPYKCGYCERSYRFRSTLIAHQHTHTGTRPYLCEPCNHHFTNWSNFNKHMKRRHGNGSTSPDESKKRRRTVKEKKTSNSNSFFVYEALDEIVDSPDTNQHEDATDAMSNESIDTNVTII